MEPSTPPKRRLVPLCEKIGRERIERQIHAFYGKLRDDAQLAHFFEHIPDFSAHERRIADFWWQAMGGRLETPPQIDMVGKHMPMGLSDADIDRWLGYFKETLDEVMEPELAQAWYLLADGIALRLRQIVVHHELPGVRPPR